MDAAPFVVAAITAIAFFSPYSGVAGYVAIILVYVLPARSWCSASSGAARNKPARIGTPDD